MSNNYYEDYLAKTNTNLRESTLLKQEKQKKSSKKGLLLLVLFLVLAGQGFYLWQKNQETQSIVDNPTETLLPMTKPEELQIEENITEKIELIPTEVIEKNNTVIEVIIPKEQEIEEKEEVIKQEKAEVKIQEEKTAEIIKVEKKTQEKEIKEIKVVKIKQEEIVIKEVSPEILEKNTTVNKIIPVKKHPLEIALLKANKVNQHPDADKKIDTFNKVILDRSVIEVSHTTKKLAEIMKATKIRIAESKNKTSKTAYTNAIKDEAEVRKDEMQYVTVKSGDSLYKIAKRIYGDATYFEVIFKANSDILKTTTDLKIGQKLRVPKLKKAQ